MCPRSQAFFRECSFDSSDVLLDGIMSIDPASAFLPPDSQPGVREEKGSVYIMLFSAQSLGTKLLGPRNEYCKWIGTVPSDFVETAESGPLHKTSS
jgi:hypothetical protein